LFFVFCFEFALLTSSGINILNCDATSTEFGCTKNNWVSGNRLQCKDNPLPIMAWATKAIINPNYTLISDSKDYIPGEYYLLTFTVDYYYGKYRGILFYAVDAAGNRVGDVVPSKYFWLPWASNPSDPCAKAAMHVSAEHKPFQTSVYFKAPPKGTGTIDFKVLYKYGDANTGEFYFPANTLSMTESKSTVTVDQVPTSTGQSCSAFCKSKGSICDEKKMELMNGEAGFDQYIGSKVPCNLPLFESCEIGAPGTNANGDCYYYGTTCGSRKSCDAIPSGNIDERICLCGAAPKGNNTLSGSSKVGVSYFALAVSSLFLFNGRSRQTTLLLVLCIVLYFGTFASAHNWIGSVSRAKGRATTIRPCLARSSPKPQVQVSTNQYFEIEWSSGHPGRFAYFVIQHADDESKMKLNLEKTLDQYLVNATAPQKVDMVNNVYSRRNHRCNVNGATNPNMTLYYFQTYTAPNTSGHIPRPSIFGGGNVHQYAYKNSDLATDAGACYTNPNLPHIECAFRYQITNHFPSAYDFARFKIPAKKGPGDYVVQWIWGGYYDCIDVNIMASDVTNIYGVVLGEEFIKEEHCQYPMDGGINGAMHSTAPYETFGAPYECLRLCKATSQANCGGVNVFLKKHPSTVYPKFQNIPTTDWNTTRSTPWWDTFKNAPDNTLICVGILPRVGSETIPEYVVTDDPNDPIFYGTCYRRQVNMDFLGFGNGNDGGITKANWKFQDKCISCQNYKDNELRGDDSFLTYGISSKCRNCEDATEMSQTTNTIFPKANLLRNNTVCDGFQGWSNVTAHSTCGGSNCTLRLYPIGPNYNLRPNECAALARRNSQCSNEIFIQRSALLLGVPSGACYCYKKDACCKTCSPKTLNNYNLYRASELNSDPTCLTGFKNGNACCSSTCKTCPTTLTSNEVGMCSSNAAAIAHRPCSQFLPPCQI